MNECQLADDTAADKEPITVSDSEIGCVNRFPYLGSLVSSRGRVNAEVKKRIASASKVFGALHGV